MPSFPPLQMKLLSTHSHSLNINDAKYMRLDDQLSKDIKLKLSLGIAINKVLDNIRDEASDRNKRQTNAGNEKYYHYLSKKRLSNMKSLLIVKDIRTKTRLHLFVFKFKNYRKKFTILFCYISHMEK